jgi:hypothetical protein
MSGPGGPAFDVASAKVRELWAAYEPPDFGHVPDPDAALFLCAVDHSTGYERAHHLDGEGPYEGSELLWAAGLRAARERPGLLTAAGLERVTAADVARTFAVDDETVADPARRAALWRDLAAGLARDHGGSAERLLAAAGGLLGGDRGLLGLLSSYEAYSDPLAKKSQLFAKLCARRGWFAVADPGSWEVSADNVLMRLALRSGLVDPGDLDEVRGATREAFKRVAAATAIPPPELDDMLWELGRADPDLLGSAAGDLREPPRDPGSAWY